MSALEAIDPVLAADYVNDAGLEPLVAADRIEGAARQLHAAGDPNRAAHLLGLAAERSSGDERVRLALEAEELFRSGGATEQRVCLARLALKERPEHREARRRLAMALANLGQDEEVHSLLAELPEAERREPRWVRAVFHAQMHSTKFADALNTWLDHPELAQDPTNVAAAVTVYTNLNDAQSAESLIVRALELPDLPIRLQSSLRGLLASIRSRQGRFEEAQALHDRSLSLARQSANATNISASLHNGSFNLYRLGRYEDAIRALEEAVLGYDDSGMFQYGADTRIRLGVTLARTGRFERAEAVLLEGLEVLRALEVTDSLADVESELALLYLDWRPPHGASLAAKFARDAVRHARQLDSPRCLLGALPAAARVEAWNGDAASALALAKEAHALMPGSVDDAHDCTLALAIALEASGQNALALEQWGRAMLAARTPEFAHEAELGRARLTQDHGRVKALLAWFEAHGLGGLALRARRCLPSDETRAEPPLVPSARLLVLGPVRLERDGQPVPTRARKRLEILAYLLETRIAGRSEASALELVDALGSDAPEPEARNALKQQVYMIRSSLGAESVISTPNGYALGAVSSDAEDFLQSDDPNLWRGAYLDGFHGGWRSEVREALMLGLRRNLEAFSPEARETARIGAILCEMEPYDLDTLLLVVQALEAAGDGRSARRLFREGRSRLEMIGEFLPETLEGFVTDQIVA
jgi:tetratricopeptide (TPR) repeat protein